MYSNRPSSPLSKEEKMTIFSKNGFLEYRFAPGGTVEIVDIQVARKGRGIGKKLVKLLEKKARGMTIYCFCREENLRGQKFYESLGFRRTALLESFYTMNESLEFGRRSGNAFLFVKRFQ